MSGFLLFLRSALSQNFNYILSAVKETHYSYNFICFIDFIKNQVILDNGKAITVFS